MSIAIEIDSSVCVGSGECVLAEPEIFAMQPDGSAAVVDQARAAALESARRDQIVAGCPSGAISVRELQP